MTRKELNRCFELRNRLDIAYNTVESLKSAATPGAQVLTGMPHSSGIKDRVGDLAIEISIMNQRIKSLEDELYALEDKIHEFMDTLEDERLCLIISLRYLRGLQWNDVADMLGISEETAKRLCYRTIDNTP